MKGLVTDVVAAIEEEGITGIVVQDIPITKYAPVTKDARDTIPVME